jgi:hypothetical protein
LLQDFVVLQQSAVSAQPYVSTLKGTEGIDRGLRERRAALLNENPARREDGDPTFVNHQPAALVGEIQQWLGKVKLEKEEEHKKGTPAPELSARITAFRIVIPVPGEHDRFKAPPPGHPARDPLWLKALEASIGERMTRLREKLESYGEMNWTYSTDGLLSAGSKEDSKHPVVGAGADVWAAGTVRLKISEGETLWRRWKSGMEKAEGYRQQAAAVKADTSLTEKERGVKLKDLEISEKTYLEDAGLNKEAYEAAGYAPEAQATTKKTVVVDFDSGHYTPSEAWRRTSYAWRKLGYNVEYNPIGRTA